MVSGKRFWEGGAYPTSGPLSKGKRIVVSRMFTMVGVLLTGFTGNFIVFISKVVYGKRVCDFRR